MPRSPGDPVTCRAVNPDEVRQVIAAVFHPGHFFVAPPHDLSLEYVDEEDTAWEIFRGRLLPPTHTRQRRQFSAWKLYLPPANVPPAEPILSVKWDETLGELHIVRALLSYVWEAYDAGNNVIE